MAAETTIKVRRPVTIKPKDRIDVRGARASYGQMVALGRILDAKSKQTEQNEESDIEFVKNIIRTLHPNIEPAVTVENVRYVYEIIDAVRFWKEQESKRLDYKPTAEEKQAGYERLAAITGSRGVAVSIGKDFSAHPDDVYKWAFGTVFTILEVDLERFKYNRRLNEIREAKRRREEQNRRMSRRR